MPYIMVKQVTGNYKVSLYDLKYLYPAYFKPDYTGQEIRANIILYKVFNNERELIQEVMKHYSLEIIDEHYICIEDICKELSIPVNYFIVFDVISIRKGYREFPVLPRDVKLNSDDVELGKVVEKEIHEIKRIRETYEAPLLLSNAGLEAISRDLTEGLRRFEIRDYEGSIKFFRKTCEGLKEHLKSIEKIDGLEKRAQEIRRLCNVLYSLLSNFGEHYKTLGGYDEAVLAKNLIVPLSAYIANKLISGRAIIKETKKAA